MPRMPTALSCGHAATPLLITKSVGPPDVPVSGVLIAIAAEAARCLHALGVRVKAAIFTSRSGRAPWILPKPLGGGFAGHAQHGRRDQQEVFHRSRHH